MRKRVLAASCCTAPQGRPTNLANHLAQVYSLSEQNRFYKQAAGYCLRAVAKHSPELAQAVVDSGALDSLVTCLEEFDPGVKVRGPGAGEKARDMRGAVLGLHNAW